MKPAQMILPAVGAETPQQATVRQEKTEEAIQAVQEQFATIKEHTYPVTIGNITVCQKALGAFQKKKKSNTLL